MEFFLVMVDTFFIRANEVWHFKVEITNLEAFLNLGYATNLHYRLGRRYLNTKRVIKLRSYICKEETRLNQHQCVMHGNHFALTTHQPAWCKSEEYHNTTKHSPVHRDNATGTSLVDLWDVNESSWLQPRTCLLNNNAFICILSPTDPYPVSIWHGIHCTHWQVRVSQEILPLPCECSVQPPDTGSDTPHTSSSQHTGKAIRGQVRLLIMSG